MTIKTAILSELDELIAEGHRLDASYQMSDMGTRESDLSEVEFQSFVTGARAAIERISGKTSEFYSALPASVPDRITVLGYGGSVVPVITGVLVALRKAVDAELLIRLEVRLRANVYDDFLVQADELLSAGYHVASMVLVGGVLEDHLRKLCDARALVWTGSGGISKYNDKLRDTVYAQTAWRRIQSIADMRNDAAHGNGASLKAEDVDDALRFVGRVLADYPA